MANENAKGAQKLIERILADAKEEAAAAAKHAGEVCADIEAQASASAEKRSAELTRQREDAAKAVIERSRTNAELSARKAELAARRSVIDKAFAAAYDKLCALPDKERAAICRDMIITEAEGGETVRAAKAEQAALALMLPAIEAAMIKAGKKPVKPSAEAADIEHGFILVGDGYEKDCSFAAMMREARSEEETNVAAILFPQGK